MEENKIEGDEMANVGDKINGAEPGWANISFGNSSITYTSLSKGINFAAGNGSASSFSFTFTGTAVRIITGLFSDGATRAEIKIDNMVEYANFKGTSGEPHIVYEKNKLPYGTHTITVRSNNTGTLSLMSIHYAAFANQGDKLAKPELGWQRYKFNEKLNDGTEAIKFYPDNIWTRYSNYIYTTSKDVGYIRFKFYGSAIRIISTHFSDTATMARITIDGTLSYYNSKGESDGDRLSFENSNLPLGIHTVEIHANNSGNLGLSAIDLKDGEYLVPLIKVGEALLQPEPGWTRYDDTDSKIKYLGTWQVTNSGYNNSLHYKNENVPPKETVAIKFKFYGKSLRIIGLKMAYYSQNALIQIDDTEPELISFYGETINTCLLYEKVGLKEGNHTVTIWGENINLDAIDINQGGFFTPPIKVGDILKEPELGWKRFDDRDEKIFYENPDGGSWKKISASPDYHNGTLTFKEHVGMPRLKVKFKFKGIQLRILATRFSTTVSKYEEAKILIDGVQYVYNQNGTANQYCTLLFESPILNQDIHTVEITTGKDPFDFDCIDILGGELFFEPAKVGDVLKEPEPGWTRVDDVNSLISYIGDSWNLSETSINYYNQTNKYRVGTTPGSVEFSFKGTGIRVVSTMYAAKASENWPEVSIEIDGVTIGEYAQSNPDITKLININQTLLFEKAGLTDGVHKIKLSGTNMNMDAFDILGGNIVKPPAKVGDILKKPEPGWKRFDDTDSNIKYKGVWATESKSVHYNSTCHYKHSSSNKPPDSNPISIKFNFEGTKLRIIGLKGNSYDSDAKILIDGKEEVINFKSTEFLYQCIVYEKLNLSSGAHTVEVKGIYMTLDAIDIDADGSLFTPAKVGDVLKEPQPGWKRFDNTDINIKYTGPWNHYTNSNGDYNKTISVKNNDDGKVPAKCGFAFFGTGIRIISQYNKSESYQNPIKITIDGSSETYTISSSLVFQCLAYEKLNLEPGTHTVVIEAQNNIIDAIDVQNGYLFTPTQIGDVLKEPESGWKRFDDRDPNILYQGNWIENENITTHYRGTFHNKPSSSGDDSIIKALFDFSGTKLRIIAFMTTGSYDVGTIKIDGEAFNFSYIKGTPTAQCLVFEKLGLEPGVHKVELSGRYINLDAIDIDETGELIPIETKKPKVSLYEKESGKIFVDDFDSINPKWLMSPFTAFNNIVKQGFLRMNHSADKDTLLLIDKPQGNVAIQVIADYTPTKEGDKGGLLIYKNEANNIEFLESMKVSDSPDPKEWMAVCKENQWDFYNKTDVMFDYVRSEQLEAHKIGVVLKKGNTEGFTPLDINKIIITTSNLLRLRQLYEKYKVVLKDAAENVISTSFVEVANTGIDIPLPSLEFEGIVEIYDEDGTLVAKRQTTFFGGDMYCMGSSLHISMDTKELNETDPTHLGYMTETERLVKMTLTNDNVGPVSNVKVAIQQYMEKFGYTWAHLSLDGSHYTDELSIETLDAGSSKDFWIKIIKDVNYMAFEPIYFNIHLSHD
ncbi:TPA: protein containing cell adhesion domain protein [Bacillus cereus]